jgi:hypothetical protein
MCYNRERTRELQLLSKASCGSFVVPIWSVFLPVSQRMDEDIPNLIAHVVGRDTLSDGRKRRFPL